MQWLFNESIEKNGQHVGGAFEVIRQSCVAVHDRYVQVMVCQSGPSHILSVVWRHTGSKTLNPNDDIHC